MNEGELSVENTIEYKGENGEKGHVAVLPDKDSASEIDIMVIPVDGKAESMRSNIEMINKLKDKNVSQDEVISILEWMKELRKSGFRF